MKTSAIPDWRRNAPAGITLAAASGAVIQAAPVSDGSPAAGMPRPDLRRILRPQVFAQWSGWLAKDWTPERIETTLRGALWGDHVQQWELFALMEDTWPRLGKALAELKRAVVQLDWRVEPWAEDGKAPTPDAEARARLVSRAVWSMRPRPEEAANGFEGTLFDLLDAWGKGVTVAEIEWQQRRAGRSGRWEIIPAATHWVTPHHYAWSDGSLWLRPGAESQGADPRNSRAVLVPFPPHKFLIATCRARTGPLMGAALLRPLAWWWSAANFSASWLLNLAQIFGLPIRWANYAPGASEELIAQICDMLENMGSNAWGAFPAGTQIELKETGKTGGTSPQDSLLDRAERQVDLLILGQTLTTDVGPSGSRALGGVHKSVRDEIVQAAGDWLATVLNLQLVPSILQLNYGDDQEAPEFRPKPVESSDLKANAERDAILLDRGVIMPRDWFHARHGIPVPADGEPVVMKPQGAPALPAGKSDMEEPPEPQTPETDAPEDTQARHAIQARRSAEQEQLATRVMEDLTPVQADWLGGAKPWFVRLIDAAGNPKVTDAEFLALVERARAEVPEQLASLVRPDAVAAALERAMGASMANGAIQGHLDRQARLRARGRKSTP